jgi:hypothetical protein
MSRYQSSSGRYHWSNTALPALFWKIPASTSIPWLLLLFHPKLYIFYIALFFTITLALLQFIWNMTLLDCLRKIKVLVMGRDKATNKIIE